MQPTLTFNPMRSLFYINAVGLKQLPIVDYALLVISPEKRRLNIFPCDANERDAVRLRYGNASKNKPRHVRCRVDFTEKLLSLMAWRSDCKYRIHGVLAFSGNDTILSFELKTAEVCTHAT
jgi:hypothetical protein